MEMIRVSSNAIRAIGYDPVSKRMDVEFVETGTYSYCRVPQQLFSQFLRASSKGAFYNTHVKDRYQCP